jgi:hypothetical protein
MPRSPRSLHRLVLLVALVAALPAEATNCPTDTPGPCYDGREHLPRERVRFEGCERVQRDPAGYCLTTISDAAAVIGLGNGERCWLDPNPGIGDESISWRGEAIYVCLGSLSGSVARGSLSEGDVVSWSLPCSAVTDYAGGILVRAPFDGESLLRDLWWFSDVEALSDGKLERTFGAAVVNDGPMATSGSKLFSTWHSTAAIDVFDLHTGHVFAPVELERENDWVRGLAVLTDGRFVLLGGITGDRVEVFGADGRLIKQIPLGDPEIPGSSGFAAGLACDSRAARQVPRRLARIQRLLR